MNTHLKKLALLPVILALGCAADPADVSPVAPSAEAAPAATPLFEVDRTELSPLGDIRLPSRTLARSAFAPSAVAAGLLGTTDLFTRTQEVAGRGTFESAAWTLEASPAGDLLALRRTPSGPASRQDDGALQARSLERLRAFGIPDEEIGVVLQRTQMVQSQEDGVLGAPEARRYKTFVMRGLGGVRVQGHRAVLTHDVDGSFVRALVHWPALASTGHKLSTRLSPDQIEARALTALSHEGLPGGHARLHWKYVPTTLETGEVTLTLAVGARIGTASEEGITEPREVDVAVDAE